MGTFTSKNFAAGFVHWHESIELQTDYCLQFIDITDEVCAVQRRSGIQNGLLSVQTKHTTTALFVNEHEPLLLEDMTAMLERLVPAWLDYQHDNFKKRTVNLTPFEDRNGHSHCKAMLLPTSQTIHIVQGEIQLGRWQRLFFLELDKARERSVSVMVLGTSFA
jgi:secondary thiamine-phosphate synthase enzyme